MCFNSTCVSLCFQYESPTLIGDFNSSTLGTDNPGLISLKNILHKIYKKIGLAYIRVTPPTVQLDQGYSVLFTARSASKSYNHDIYNTSVNIEQHYHRLSKIYGAISVEGTARLYCECEYFMG